MSDHHLHLVGFSYQSPDWRLTCDHEPGGRWRCTNQDGTPSPNHDESECWLESWWSELGIELMADVEMQGGRLPIPVRPSSDWDYENGGTLVIDEPAPSPYRFTVSVEHMQRWWVSVEFGESAVVQLSFDTEAEARSHAVLVLAALHQATLEEA
jgi:hypothetical protein